MRYGAARVAWLGCLCFGVSFGIAAGARAQAAPAQPLLDMPYSPSLDLTSLDRTVDPCVDFYKFACGGWQKNNPIPADQAGWSVYAKLADENMQFLWGILQVDAKPSATRTPVQQKIGDSFSACMDTAAIDAQGDKPIQPMLAAINGLPNRAALIAYITTLQHQTTGSYFFDSGPAQDPSDSNQVLADVSAGGLGLPDRDYYLKIDPRSVDIRAKYVQYITHLLTLTGEPTTQAVADAKAILHVETELAKASLSRVEMRDPYKTFHKMTIAQLDELAPSIAWPVYFKTEGARSLSTLNVAQPAFLKTLNVELTTEPVDVLKAYMRFHLITGAAPALASPFETARFDFYSGYLRGTKQMPPRWKSCVRQVDRSLGEALGQEFVQRTFTADTKLKTQLMTDQIEQQMQFEIEHLDWMTDATRQEALRKLHAIRNKIGYPEHWRDYSSLTIKPHDYFGNTQRAARFEDARQWAKIGEPTDRNEWGMTPPTVNAYYNPQMNDINFPAGVLQPPLYDSTLDDAPNYGNTGATIGHELTHGFDDEGRQFDGAGNLKDWWTKQDAKNFDDRINCVRDQYAGYSVVDDIHINSKLTSGEDVADIGGTLLAYLAWKQATAGKELHPIDGFTPDQRFFIGMGQWACENSRPENLRVQALTDPHSPGAARINGVVSDLPQFAKAFGCKANQPMVRTNACKVW